MDTELIKQLLEAGSHFGHNRSRLNPRMKPFIFGERSKIYIIDLEKTVSCLSKAKEFLKKIVANGEKVLFVGTKKQAQPIIQEAALKTDMFFVIDRWLGGTLTNFKTIKNSIKRLKDIERMEEDGTFQAITKKEKAILNKEKDKLSKNLQGIVDMKEMPGAVFIVDAKKEEIAVKEAKKLSIPIVSIIDTNSDPTFIDYPIPANDDAMRSIKLIVDAVTESIMEGKKLYDGAEIKRKKTAQEIIDEKKALSEDEDDEIEQSIKIAHVKEKEAKKIVTKKKLNKDLDN